MGKPVSIEDWNGKKAQENLNIVGFICRTSSEEETTNEARENAHEWIGKFAVFMDRDEVEVHKYAKNKNEANTQLSSLNKPSQ